MLNVIPARFLGTNAEYGRIPGKVNNTIINFNNPVKLNLTKTIDQLIGGNLTVIELA